MKKAKAKSRRRSLVRRWDGKLTQELVLHPGDFGLGKVPKRLIPDDATDVVCGFCSTGCSLRIHLKDGQAINLSPTSEYPVNLGMACPKGWEALTPLRSPDRATTPLLRNQSGTLEPVDWDTALQIFTLRFKAIQDQFGSDSVAWLGTGQICTEELAFLGAIAKFGMGIVHGDEYPSMHGDLGDGLQAVFWLRRASLYLQRLRRIGRPCFRWLKHLHRAPDHVAACLSK